MVDTAFRSDERFTQDEFRRWLDARSPSDINHYELVDGRIVMTPPAGWPHGRIGIRVGAALHQHVTALGLGIVLDSSTGFDLPSGDTLEPDVSFISSERFAAGPAPERGEFLRIVPTLVVEILSPSTAKRDRTEKKDVYLKNGVSEYWMVDPDARSVTVHALGTDPITTRTFTTGSVSSVALPGLAVPVEDVFAP